jgi:hypothetical protein
MFLGGGELREAKGVIDSCGIVVVVRISRHGRTVLQSWTAVCHGRLEGVVENFLKRQ